MKTCTKCGETKGFDKFYRESRMMSGFRPDCKSCHNKVQRKKYKANRDVIREYQIRYYQDNKAAFAAKSAKRRARKLNATPEWSDLDQIKRIYATCAKITDKTGIQHHVDHVIPLQGENICGLHVPNNLAIIPAKMNLQKSNKY